MLFAWLCMQTCANFSWRRVLWALYYHIHHFCYLHNIVSDCPHYVIRIYDVDLKSTAHHILPFYHVCWFYLNIWLCSIIILCLVSNEEIKMFDQYYGHLFSREIISTNIKMRAWMSNSMHVKQWNVITHPCQNLNGGLVKLPLKLGHGWVITSFIKLRV